MTHRSTAPTPAKRPDSSKSIDMRPIFVGGCERSGTTLLGSLLGASPGAITIPESRFRINALIDSARLATELDGGDYLDLMMRDSLFALWSLEQPTKAAKPPRYRDAVESIVAAYAHSRACESPRVWIDHTPINVRYALEMEKHFPEGRFIHIIRDGRAVSASMLDLDWGPNSIWKAARHWTDRIAVGLALESSEIGRKVIRVRYEDLVSDTNSTMRRLCGFCEIEFDPEMLEGGRFAVPPHMKAQNQLVGHRPEADRIHGWRQRLSRREVEIFESAAGELMRLLGYDPIFGIAARPPSSKELIKFAAQEWYRTKIFNKPRKRRRLSLSSPA